MKKFLLTFLGGAALMSASAAIVETPFYFQEDFSGSNTIPEGWIQYGVDATPSGSYSNLFPDYGPKNSFSISNQGILAAFSPSKFSDGSESDQWLITPEIYVDDPELILSYTVSTLGNTSKNKYKVLISEGGVEKEAFTKKLTSTSITGKGSTLVTAAKRTTIDGYKGKTIRLAFVNYENTDGIVGFGDISINQYELVMDEAYADHYVATHDKFLPAFQFRLSTPTATEGVTAVLTTDNGYISTSTNSTAFGSSVLSFSTIEFPDEMTMTRSVVEFTLKMTPNFEGAATSEIRGKFIKAPYQGIAVMEEYTGTWCSNCPSGIAVMGYLKATYGIENGGGFAGIAIHGDDVMQPSFFSSIQAVIPSNNYPWAFLNRDRNAMPQYVDVKPTLETPQGVNVKISRVDYDRSSSSVKIKYGVSTVYDTENPGYNAFAYILENNVQGTGVDYAQKNANLYTTADDIIRNYGEEYLPYFEPFLGKSVIPAEDMKYQDVARGAYPSVTGSPISGPLEMCVYKQFSINASMPSSVMKPENTEVVVILLNSETGKPVAADILGASHFNQDIFEITGEPTYPEGFDPTSDVVEVAEICGSISTVNGTILVNSDSNGVVEIFGLDGKRYAETRVNEGISIHKVDLKGLVIVRLVTPNGIISRKVIL